MLHCAAIIPTATAQDAPELDAILNANDRNIAHLLRDEARKPAAVLSFLGISPGMRVLDVYAADGYYTYLLAKLVDSSGQVYAQNPAPGSNVEDIRQMYSLADALDAMMITSKLDNVVHLRENFFDLSIEPTSLDRIMLVQILHDFYNADAAASLTLLNHLVSLLKPGGSVVIIDHAGDDGQDNARLHRMPKSAVLALAAEAGLILTGDSAILANPADRRRRPVFDPMLGRNTDRFLLRFTRSAGALAQ